MREGEAKKEKREEKSASEETKEREQGGKNIPHARTRSLRSCQTQTTRQTETTKENEKTKRTTQN